MSDINLDAVRARYVEATRYMSSHAYASASADDVPALVAEIERLREVQAIMYALAAGPTTLLDHKQTAITAAIDYGVIEASAQVGQGYTRYRLRKTAVPR